MKDDLRPRGSVQVPCSGVGCPTGADGGRWFFWVQALDPRLPEGPFRCPQCELLELCERETGRKVLQALGPPTEPTPEQPGGQLISWVFADSGEPLPEKYECRPVFATETSR